MRQVPNIFSRLIVYTSNTHTRTRSTMNIFGIMKKKNEIHSLTQLVCLVSFMHIDEYIEQMGDSIYLMGSDNSLASSCKLVEKKEL